MRALHTREHRLAIVTPTCVAFAIARIGRTLFLLDLPITDDEYVVEFGGRVPASGHLMVRLPLLREPIPDLFLLFRNGAVGSFDWPGGVAIAALAEVTHLHSLGWTAVAVAPVPILIVLTTERLGRAWGHAAAAIFQCSPMATLMSMTFRMRHAAGHHRDLRPGRDRRGGAAAPAGGTNLPR